MYAVWQRSRVVVRALRRSQGSGLIRPAVVGAVILGARPTGRRPPSPEDDSARRRMTLAGVVAFGVARALRVSRSTPLPLLPPIPRGSERIAVSGQDATRRYGELQEAA